MPSEFFQRTRRLVREKLHGDLRDFEWSAVSFMAKLWYGNKDLHYELWSRERLRTLELGLHFESDPLTNARLLAAFRANGKTVQRALPGARIEEWDRGWARVWEGAPLRAMDATFAADLAERLVGYITTLEPILRRELPSDVPWSPPKPRAARVTAGAPSRVPRRAR